MECPQYSTRLEALAYLYMSISVPSDILIHPAIWPQETQAEI